MVAGFEPFLISAVPGDIATAIGSAGSAIAVALWRRVVNLEDRNRIDRETMMGVIRDGVETQKDLIAISEQVQKTLKDVAHDVERLSGRLAG